MEQRARPWSASVAAAAGCRQVTAYHVYTVITQNKQDRTMQTRVFKAAIDLPPAFPKSWVFPMVCKMWRSSAEGDELIIRPLRQHRLTSFTQQVGGIQRGFATGTPSRREPRNRKNPDWRICATCWIPVSPSADSPHPPQVPLQ